MTGFTSFLSTLDYRKMFFDYIVCNGFIGKKNAKTFISDPGYRNYILR